MELNFEKIKGHFDGDMETLAEVLEVFEESSQESLSGIEAALKSSNHKELDLHAHTLKGMIMNFFVSDVSEKAKKLELMGKEKMIRDDGTRLLAELREDVKKIVELLKAKFEL